MSSPSIVLAAPAKLNLSLHVGGRMPNGLHRLRSILQPLSFSDRLEVKLREADDGIELNVEFSDKLLRHLRASYPGAITTEWFESFSSEKNLAHRSAELFLEAFSAEKGVGVEINLLKRIPIEAGLGGGSADAAAVLKALKHLFGLEGKDAELAEIAASLGSDVPALLHSSPILLLGTGEKVIPLEYRASESIAFPHLLLLKPPLGVSTREAYEALGRAESEELPPQSTIFFEEISQELRSFHLAPESSIIPDLACENELTFLWQDGIDGVPENSSKMPWSFGALENDFQLPMRARFQEIDEAFRMLLQAGAKGLVLAGSGSTVCGFFESEVSKEALDLQRHFGEAWFVETSGFA